MSQPNTIINELTEEFNKNPSIIAFTLVGSKAREDVYRATEYSDMEAYVITGDEDAEKVEQQLPDLLSKFGNVLFSFQHQIGFVAVYEDLFRIELPVIKQADMESLFSRPKAQVVKVLIDRTDGELEKVLANRPDITNYAELFKDKVINFWYWQILAIQYFKKGEFYNTRAVLGINSSALIKLFELLNDPTVLDLETNKRIERFLTEEQLTCLSETSPAYKPEQIKQALNRIMDIFPDVIKAVKNKYGYNYDESIEEKVKPKLLELLDKP